MNKIITLIVAVIIINSFFSFISFMLPRANKGIILPYQVWFNVLIVFIIILPNSVGNFAMLYN